MLSSPGAVPPSDEFLQLSIQQQIVVVNNQYHVGNLGYFDLPTGLELPEHGWHGGGPWGFRRSPAAERNLVFERSPEHIPLLVPADEGDHRLPNAFEQAMEDLERDIGVFVSASAQASSASGPGGGILDDVRGMSVGSSLSDNNTGVAQAWSSTSLRHPPPPDFTLRHPPPPTLHRYDHHPRPSTGPLGPPLSATSIPLPPPLNPDPARGRIFTDRGIFSDFPGPRPRRSKTHPSTNSTPTFQRGAVRCIKTAPAKSSSARHRSHSVLDPPRDLNHQVRTYTVTDPATGGRVDLLDDDDYDPPTSYKLADIRPEDRERAEALGKRRCTRCRRWRPEYRFQHKHNRCMFCQARIDAGVWLVGNQKRKRVDTIEEEEEEDAAAHIMDDADPAGRLKRHHPGGGGFGAAGNAVSAC